MQSFSVNEHDGSIYTVGPLERSQHEVGHVRETVRPRDGNRASPGSGPAAARPRPVGQPDGELFEIRSGNTGKPELDLLSDRERQVLEQLASSKNNDAIAAELGVAVQTVRNYISTVYDKLGVRSRAEAVVWARVRWLIFPA